MGNHSWSHLLIEPDMVDVELRQAREVLEQAIDGPVHLYCAPGDNSNMSDHVLAACREMGYLGAMSLTDALNRPEEELFWINRTALHDQYYGPFFSEFDPFRNVRHAQEDGGWIIDYCHCPLEEAVHRNKDCSEAQLRERFETVLDEGGTEVWCAVPEEVVFYHLCRRHLRIETVVNSDSEQRYRLSFEALSERVGNRQLTFEAQVPGAWCRFPQVWVNGVPQAAEIPYPGILRMTVDVGDGVELAVMASDRGPARAGE